MNDPLKKYIQDNRDDFDNLEPSADIFLRLKRELKETPKENKGVIRLLVNHKWLVAASILITFSLTYLLFTNDRQNKAENAPQVVKNLLPDAPISVPDNTDNANQVNSVKAPVRVARKAKKLSKNFDMLALYHKLTDSTSASTRLAAILSIQKSNNISYDVIDKLTQTLNHDSNSNVRLAALNLMSKYVQDSYVNNVFMLSLSNQKDPLLQLGLMELLRQTNNPKLDDKLYALANDPATLSEVKDQAYLILINQNKL